MKQYFFELVENEGGKHQIGGKKPNELNYPKNNFIANFQYLGFLDNSDKNFNWLPFKLHLIYPIYTNAEELILDYTNEVKPVIIYPESSDQIDSEFTELTTDSYIEFDSRKIKLVKTYEIDDMNCIGVSNIPFEIQELDVPVCPKSGNIMRFVCQLMTFGEIPVKIRNVESDYDELSFMNFWSDGSLFVFCEPEAKTVCYFIQNT